MNITSEAKIVELELDEILAIAVSSCTNRCVIFAA
jgi:hypothetical protein